MGLVLVCPQCQARVTLQSQSCPYCQADLRDVPQDRRRYVLGQAGPFLPPSGPEPMPAPEAATGEVKIRRPHVRRYAAPAVSQLEGNVAPAAPTAPGPVPAAAAALAGMKIRRPHVRRYAATPVGVSQPVPAKAAKNKGGAAEASKPTAKKGKKASAGKKKK
ncbi:MAG: hypothetical protein FJ135_16855 [Deltaproteobacteria bacterium]|nr:hypothetical protein [Deltaproteobacteria bacterium]